MSAPDLCPGCANPISEMERLTGRCAKDGGPLDRPRQTTGMPAVITRKGRCAEDGYTEPYARLEDGRVMPMGWNLNGPILEVGTPGTASYVRGGFASLWSFTPDEAQS